MIVQVVLVDSLGGLHFCEKDNEGKWSVRPDRDVWLSSKVIAIWADGTTTEHAIREPDFTVPKGMKIDVSIKGVL